MRSQDTFHEIQGLKISQEVPSICGGKGLKFRFKFLIRAISQAVPAIRKGKDRVYAKLRRYPLSMRFFVVCLFLCMVPLILTSGIVFFSSYHQEVESYVSLARQSMVQMSNNLFSRLMNLRTDAIDLAYNSYVQDYTHNYSRENSNTGRVPVTDEVVHAVVARFNSTSDSGGLIILSPDGRPCYVYYQNRFSMYLYDEAKRQIMENIEQKNSGYWHYAMPDDYYLKNLEGQCYPAQEEEPVIYYSLKMKRLVGDEYVGYLLMTLRPGVLTELFSQMESGNDVSTVYLLDRDGRVMMQNGGEEAVDETVMERLKEVDSSGVSTFASDRLFGDSFIAMKMEETGWYIVNVIDGGALTTMALRSSMDVLFLLFAMMILIPCIFYVLNRTIRHPLRRILGVLEEVKRGDFSARIQDVGGDEFAVIAKSIDNMSEKLTTMIQQVKNSEQQRQEAQIELLQMQINPHFITNTLNTVAWMADMQQQAKLSHILQSLSALLNRTLRSGREFIPLSEELDYIKWYIDIQQYRGVVDYRLHLSIDEELMPVRLPPFTLEPLVENSVIHGTGAGRSTLDITIKGYRTGDVVELSVTDNGCGMDETTLRKLEQMPEKHVSKLYSVHGIGVANVQKRLQMYFGTQYGVSYDSMPGCFTMAVVRLPVTFDGEVQLVSCDDR